jgi:ubiquinone/menaquinone biosynthesis C-methylase UbiE
MLTLFPRIRPNPVMAPPPAPPEEKESAAEIPSSEESQLSPENIADSGVTAEIAEVVAIPHLQEQAGTSSTDSLCSADSLASVDTNLSADAALVAEAARVPEVSPEAVDVVEQPEIDSSLIEGPEMVAAFLSSLKDATKKEDAEPPAASGQVAAPEIEIAAANIYDEIEILHEADAVAAPAEVTEEAGALEDSGVPETAAEAVPEASQPDVGEAQETVHAASEVVEESGSSAEEAADASETVAESAQTDEVAADVVAETAATTAAVETPVSEVAEPVTAAEVVAEAPPRPAKRKRPEGLGFFGLERIPEPEAMEDSDEVEAYASAAAQSHLDAIDDTFVAHAQLLLKGRERGRALDIGTGPGQIVLKLGYQLTRWKFVGVDRSAAMIEKAREGLESAPELAGRVEFQVADGNRLDFPNASFDLVVCNSVLHHLAEPQKLFSEMVRLVKPDGAILLRDLRRPARFEFSAHVRKHGKHYSGEMKRLFIASVQAAYTLEELEHMVLKSHLQGVRVFRHRKTHIGFEREASARLK